MLSATNGEEMSDPYNISVATSLTNTTAPIEKTFVDSQEEEKDDLLGPLLGAGALIVFAITVVYLLVRRGEVRKEQEATREEENRRLFLKKHIDINIYTDCSSGHIDDEEAQEEETTNGIGNEDDRDDCCSTSSIHDNKDEEIPHIEEHIEEARSFEDEKICLICHEQFKAGDEIASSRNDVCCQSIFHSECIISWLMTDHSDCPLCRNTFVLKRMTSKKK